MKRYLRIAKITSVVVVASLISSPIIAYAGSSGYVGEVSNVFNDDTDSGEGFTWSYSDSILTLTDNVNGNVVADNDITITTSDNPVTVSGNIEVSTADPSTNADLTIDNANITTSGSISADGDVKIIDSTVSADGINGGKDGKGTEGNVIITDSNVTSTDTIAAGNDEQISSHAMGEYGNHNIVIDNSNVTANAKASSIETQYPIVAVGGTVTINEGYISTPTDGSILNQGYYGTDIYLGEVGRIVTTSSEGGYGYKGEAIIKAGDKPSTPSESTDTDNNSNTPKESESTDTNNNSNTPKDSESTDTNNNSNTPKDSESTDTNNNSNTPKESESTDTNNSSNTSKESEPADTNSSSNTSKESESADTNNSSNTSKESEPADTNNSSNTSKESEPADTNSSSNTSTASASTATNSRSGESSDDNNLAEAYVTTTSDYANVYKADISNDYFAAVSNNSGSDTIAVKESNGKLMKVAVDLTSASAPKGYSSKITATIVPALDRNNNSINGLDKTARALNTIITESGKTPIEGSLFIRAYAAGVSLTKLETPAKYTFTLDKSYEGKTITVFVRTVTGEIHSYDAVVTNGKVQISTEFLGTVAFAM